jgi:hypothetical protein
VQSTFLLNDAEENYITFFGLLAALALAAPVKKKPSQEREGLTKLPSSAAGYKGT